MRATESPPERPPAAAGYQPELAWLALWLICLVLMVVLVFARWADEPLELIPVLATMFVAMAWLAHRRTVARDRARIAADHQRLIDLHSRFLQDASHQLRTPITIALGHAELLAQALAGQEERDIHVVVGELERLRTLSEGLLLVAASQSPDFLNPEPADLDAIAVELLRRWRPTAPRSWRLGQLEPVTVLADPQRLALALDALVENAVRHTAPGDDIIVSVLPGPNEPGESRRRCRIAIEDSGEGIAESDLPYIFDRFTTIAGQRSGSRGTGLGLALVQAVARGHGGEVRVRSTLGSGSRFELLLPAAVPHPESCQASTLRARASEMATRKAW